MKFNILIITLLVFLCGCNKGDDAPTIIDSKPIELETLAVETANAKQVILSGRILHLNNEDILEHGFVVESNYFGEVKTTEYKSDKKVAAGKVTFEINDGSLNNPYGTYYTYYYYIKTATNSYKGANVSIVVSDLQYNYIHGLQATIGEKIVITGKFDQLDGAYSLYAGWDKDTRIPFALGDNNNTLVFEMPTGFAHGQEVSFNLRPNNEQNNSIATLATVKVLGQLLPPADYSFYYSDALRLSGPGAPRGSAEGLSIIIGDRIVPYFYELRLHDLLNEASGTEFRLGYSNGRDTYIFPEKLKIKQPAVDQFSFWQRIVHPGGTTVGGRVDLGQFGYADASVGGKLAWFNNIWSGTDEVSIGLVDEGEYPLVLKGPILNYTSQSKIKVEKLKATAVSPKQGYYGDELTLSGNFIDGNVYIVDFGDYNKNTYVASGGKLKFPISNYLPTGDAAIKLGYETRTSGTVSVESGLSIKVLAGTFDDFSPKYGPPGTIITLQGKGLASGQIFFADERLYPYDYSSAEVKIQVPYTATKGKKRISVFYRTGWVSAPALFEVQ